MRAVRLTGVAGLGQGLDRYMQPASSPTPCERIGKTFVLREGVLENARARSAVVRLSTNPSSAFEEFQPADPTDEDLTRAPVAPRRFADGTVFKQGFKVPVMEIRRRAWRGSVGLEAKVVAVRTDHKSSSAVQGRMGESR